IEDEAGVRAAVLRALGTPTPDRLRVIAQAFRHGLSVEEIAGACAYEPWFLRQIEEIVREEGLIRVVGLPGSPDLQVRNGGSNADVDVRAPQQFRKWKAMGFSDARLAQLTGSTEKHVRALRRSLGVRPVFKRIDTCAAEFASATAYMYSTYES